MDTSQKKNLLILTGIVAAAFILVLYFVLSSPKTYVIGYINPNPTEFEGAQGFLRNLPKYGFEEGKNTTIIKSEIKDKAEIEKAIRGMVAKKVDLIFTMTTPAAKMAVATMASTRVTAAANFDRLPWVIPRLPESDQIDDRQDRKGDLLLTRQVPL